VSKASVTRNSASGASRSMAVFKPWPRRARGQPQRVSGRVHRGERPLRRPESRLVPALVTRRIRGFCG
jgi:hypothetical protein